MEPEFVQITPTTTYFKIIPPYLPIYYTVQQISEQYPIILINHPKTAGKTAKILTKHTCSFDTNTDSLEIDGSYEAKPSQEINIISILIKEISMKMDLTTNNEETIAQIKQKILNELESFCNEKLNDTILSKDLKFFYNNMEINEQSDHEKIEIFVKKNNLSAAFLGNILYLDIRILDQIKCYQLIIRLYIEKMLENTLLTTVVKFQKINKKLASRILLIKNEEDGVVTVVIQELNNNKTSNFPLNAIKFVERLDESDPLIAEEIKEFKSAVPVRLKFLPKLQWENMFLVFLYEESYLKFLVTYLETKKLDTSDEDEIPEEELKESGLISRNQKSLSINLQKNTKVTESDTQKVSKFLHIKELGKELKERTESLSLKKKNQNLKPKQPSPSNLTKNKSPIAKKNSRSSIILENELKNLIILNSTFTEVANLSNNMSNSQSTTENIDSPLGKNTPKSPLKTEISKEDIQKYEKNFCILAQGGMFSSVFYKNEQILRFYCENLEIQFFHIRNNKFICSYLLQDIENLNKDSEIQATLIFKAYRKIKNLSLLFTNKEDLSDFLEIYEILHKKSKKQKPNELEIKDFLKKNIRRYSWLNQPLNALLPKKTSAEYAFQIINENFSPSKQVLHLNFIHKIISFLKKDKEKTNILKEFNIQKIIHLQNSYQDLRRLTLKLEKKKAISVLFPNVKQKLVFESAVNAILKENLPSADFANRILKEKIYVTTWNVGFSEPPENLGQNSWNFLGEAENYFMIIIGLQECKANSWIDSFQKKLKAKFSLISVVTMWRMTICALIRKDWFNHVKNLEVSSKPTGIGKIIGNKGGVMISFTLFDTSFCFLSCHLPAKPNREHERRLTYHDLIRSLRTGVKTMESVFQFDYVFWLGDLNFRINGPFDLVLEMVTKNELEKLKSFCQLAKARNNNLIFSDFEEALIEFQPSYRRIRHNSGYSNKKNQAPSWCDRIFYRHAANHCLQVVEYNSKEMQLGSDHRPVYGIFELEIQTPYIPSVPFYMRTKLVEGIIKFRNIEIDYYYKQLAMMNEGLTFPFEVYLTFYAPFLVHTPVSASILMEKEEEFKNLRWDCDMTSEIFTAIGDQEFLSMKNLSLILYTSGNEKENEMMIGQISIPLNILFNEKNGIFDGRVSFYGRVFGLFKCQIDFCLNEEEN